jgi:hypothetical protein
MTNVKNVTEKNGSEDPPLQEAKKSGSKPQHSKKSGGGFGAEYPLEARSGELDADEFFTAGL